MLPVCLLLPNCLTDLLADLVLAKPANLALWLLANLAGSKAIDQIKSYTSRFLRREFPELKGQYEDALWQRGGFVGSFGNGGDLVALLR